MLILAITTSSKTCSVALLEDSQILIELNIENEKTHSENLMPLIDKAFKETGKNVSDVNLISCDIGPGSFTGIRIGIATCKAIAEVNQIPICSSSSLEGLSYNVSSTTICSLIDARNNQVYCGIFNNIYYRFNIFYNNTTRSVIGNNSISNKTNMSRLVNCNTMTCAAGNR